MASSGEAIGARSGRISEQLIGSARRLRQRLRDAAFGGAEATPCLIKATAAIGDGAEPESGYVVKLSSAGAVFRPSTLYIERRDGALSLLEIAGEQAPATVAETTASGYRLNFRRRLSDETLQAWLAASRVSLSR